MLEKSFALMVANILPPLTDCWSMSASGQTEKSGRSTGKSALAPTPDVALHRTKRRDVPRADLRLIDRRRVFASGNQQRRFRTSIESRAGILPKYCKAWCRARLKFVAPRIRRAAASACQSLGRRRALVRSSISRAAILSTHASNIHSRPLRIVECPVRVINGHNRPEIRFPNFVRNRTQVGLGSCPLRAPERTWGVKRSDRPGDRS